MNKTWVSRRLIGAPIGGFLRLIVASSVCAFGCNSDEKGAGAGSTSPVTTGAAAASSSTALAGPTSVPTTVASVAAAESATATSDGPTEQPPGASDAVSGSPAPTARAAPSGEVATKPRAAAEPSAKTTPKLPPKGRSESPASTPSSTPTSAPELPSVAAVEAPPPAAPDTADAVAEKVDAIYVPIQRFRARFQQKYTAKIAGTTKNSDGVCYIKRPGKVSFSYHSPNKNRVVSDGVTLKIYEAENQQMFTRPVATTEYPGALAFILGKGLRHSFSFAFNAASKWEGGPVIIGTPRVPNPGYEKVLFYIDEELLGKGDPACVRRVLVIDAQGNRNRFDFIHVEQPESIPETEFEFTPPPGTNVLQ